MIIAAIDVGTNTALLLIAEVGGGGFTPLYTEERFVRLGEGVDATRRVGEAARSRLREALLAYRERARAYGAAEIVVAATSASRDAENKAELAAYVRQETGLSYEILSGEEEARWTFAGALSAFPPAGRCTLIDVGGGSTEVVVGEADGEIRSRQSLNIGSVRLAERFFGAQPPAPADVARAEAFILRVLREAGVRLDPALPCVGAAGTLVSLALVDGGAASWAALPEAAVLPAASVHAWRERLLAASYDEVLALNPPVLRGRADVFPAGVLILDVLLQHFGLPGCRVSPRGLRHGLVLRRMAQDDASPGAATGRQVAGTAGG
jgi:exopolyphosphatase/guanosine-5'-triphosphate,3'-diphosphate pyrophosphatase